MARPRANVDEIRADMLVAAEALLAESRGRRLVLSDVAERIGLSQSYAHRFFPTKRDLIRSLAERWFAEVEAEGARVCSSSAPPDEKLNDFVLAVLRLKRARYDVDPPLFEAYMALARDHMDVVGEHAARLRAQLSGILAEIVEPHKLQAATDLVEDATVPFRVPMVIALFRDRATDERAAAVVAALLKALRD